MDSIPSRMRRNGTDPALKNRIAYCTKHNSEWVSETYEAYYSKSLQVARALLAVGLKVEGKICILSFNSPRWTIADIGCMMAGGAPAGIYQTCSPAEVQYIIHHSESIVVFVENRDQWQKVQDRLDELPLLQHIVLMNDEAIEGPKTITWSDFIALGDKVEPEAVNERIDSISPSQQATFIYTSGTTGPPKAVMLSHENLSWTSNQALKLVQMDLDDVSLSYLPLSHIAEQIFTIHGPISVGSTVYFAESIEKLPDNLKEVQPTVFFGVPRIWEKFNAGIQGKLALATGFKAKLAARAMEVGRQVNAKKNQGQTLGMFDKMRYRLYNKLIFSKVKSAIGLGRVKICISGAAPISPEILEFMSGLDVVIHEVYGQSEGSGPTSFNQPGGTKFGSVGPAFPGVEIKLAEDEEILVRGKNIFLGYYKDEKATNAALVDGWLHSGDLGKFDEDGFLTIIGRKKEIIITAGGKNITPKNIESGLRDISLISQAVVIGDRRKFLSALITLDPEVAGAYAKEKGISEINLHENADVLEVIQAGVDSVNAQFARVEHVRKFTVLPRDLTIDDGELTPTLKIKRRIVNENWSKEIEAMYVD